MVPTQLALRPHVFVEDIAEDEPRPSAPRFILCFIGGVDGSILHGSPWYVTKQSLQNTQTLPGCRYRDGRPVMRCHEWTLAPWLPSHELSARILELANDCASASASHRFGSHMIGRWCTTNSQQRSFDVDANFPHRAREALVPLTSQKAQVRAPRGAKMVAQRRAQMTTENMSFAPALVDAPRASGAKESSGAHGERFPRRPRWKVG